MGICLNTRYPMCIYWGPEYVMLYNDAFRAIMGEKHPWGLGRPAREVGQENFGGVETRFAKVYNENEAIWSEDELFPYREGGRLKERYFNYTLSPIPGEGGATAGILNTVIETSDRVISERRSRLLRDLVEGTAGALSASSVCSRTVELLANGQADVPFSLIYKPNWEKGGREARLFAAAAELKLGAGKPPGHPIGRRKRVVAPASRCSNRPNRGCRGFERQVRRGVPRRRLARKCPFGRHSPHLAGHG